MIWIIPLFSILRHSRGSHPLYVTYTPLYYLRPFRCVAVPAFVSHPGEPPDSRSMSISVTPWSEAAHRHSAGSHDFDDLMGLQIHLEDKETCKFICWNPIMATPAPFRLFIRCIPFL